MKATYEELLAQNRSLAARVQELERELGELKEKAYRYAHWTPEHTIEEWLADRQRIVEAKQVEADAALRQQLAEAQETIIRKDEALEINRQAHGIVRDQLTQAEQQVARLRACLVEYMTLADKICYAEPELTQYRNMKTKASHALRETGAGKEDATMTVDRVGCATAEQVEKYIKMANDELGPDSSLPWVEDIRQFLRTRYNTR